LCGLFKRGSFTIWKETSA